MNELWERPWPIKLKRTGLRPSSQFLRDLDLVLQINAIQEEIAKSVGYQPGITYYSNGKGSISWKGYRYPFGYIGHALDLMKEVIKTGQINSWVERFKEGVAERETPNNKE